MESTVIKLKNLSKTFYLTKTNKVEALKNVSLEIKQGDFLALMGPSGSGKSTLLNLVGLLDIPDENNGELLIDDHNPKDLNKTELAYLRRDTIGFIFQTFNLLPRMNAWENVLLPMRYAKVPRKSRKDRTKKLLTMMNLQNRIKHKPAELSGGERQRVAIARALANQPKIILADEPTGNLDSKSGQDIMKILKELNRKEGVTMIIVTHDQEIADMTDYTIKLKDGELCS
ncbi:ABC transporter ATP-binding protein [Patescibacteria group bacterium]|nr:ABC transporter ATP-binding protein [Patescibacteria group bacterium]MBU1673794.1 ABC transporter ATP-binding protein [Patescibacteria group bacterium]MBU1963821.1 ABC transporter ATP-binding protein [Patescibacteria group bacterium]